MRAAFWILAVALALLSLSCRAMHYEQAGLTVNAARVKLTNSGAFSLAGVSASSSRGPITRFVYKVGQDVNGDGKLDAADGQLLIDVDNSNPSASVTAANISGQIGKGETWIVHMEIYQGGDKPVFSKSWTNKN